MIDNTRITEHTESNITGLTRLTCPKSTVTPYGSTRPDSTFLVTPVSGSILMIVLEERERERERELGE